MKNEGSLHRDSRIEDHARSHIIGNAISRLQVSTHIGDFIKKECI